MAMDPMPYGSGEFSFTMDTSLAYLWPATPAPAPTPVAKDDDDTHCHKYKERLAELEERLAGASSELRRTREDVRLKHHKIASLADFRRRNKHDCDRLHHLLTRKMEAMTPTGGGVSGLRPLPSSSSSPEAVHRRPMFNSFALPSPAAVVAAHEGRSRAVALQGPRFAPVVVGEDTSAAAAPQLQILAARSTATAIQVPRFAPIVVGEDRSDAAAPQLQIVAAKIPLASSSSPVAVHRPPMINPFAVPSPTAVVPHEGTSTATAILVPSEDRSAAAAAQLQLPAAKSPVASSSSRMAVDPSALFKVPSSAAAAAAVVEEGSTSTAAAQLASTRLLALDGRTALFQPSTMAHGAAVSEHRSAAAPAQLGLLAARRPLPLHGPAWSGQSAVVRGAAVVAYRSAATAAHLEMLAAKRPLPQKGRLVQAVKEAGPLLENLMVGDPLPRWRNPPPALANAMASAPSSSGAQMGLPWSAH